jgi:hypothetical protein
MSLFTAMAIAGKWRPWLPPLQILSGDRLRRAEAVMAAFERPDDSDDEAALRDEFEGLMAAS